MAGLTLLVIRCPDIIQTKEFYECFGLSFVDEKHGNGPRHFAAVLDNDTVLEIYPVGNKRPTADLRIGFLVRSLSDTQGQLVSIAADGVVLSEDGQVLTAHDPVGNTVVAEEG